jgi:hypothetical protein
LHTRRIRDKSVALGNISFGRLIGAAADAGTGNGKPYTTPTQAKAKAQQICWAMRLIVWLRGQDLNL